MNSATRKTLAFYCLSVFFCCVWLPWKFDLGARDHESKYTYFVGYSTLWNAPPAWQIRAHVPPLQPEIEVLQVEDPNGRWSYTTRQKGGVDDRGIEKKYPPPSIDSQRIALELAALTAFFGFAFCVTQTEYWRSTLKRWLLRRRLSRGLSQQDQETLVKLVRGDLTEQQVRTVGDNPRLLDALEAARQARKDFDKDPDVRAAIQGLLRSAVRHTK